MATFKRKFEMILKIQILMSWRTIELSQLAKRTTSPVFRLTALCTEPYVPSPSFLRMSYRSMLCAIQLLALTGENFGAVASLAFKDLTGASKDFLKFETQTDHKLWLIYNKLFFKLHILKMNHNVILISHAAVVAVDDCRILFAMA